MSNRNNNVIGCNWGDLFLTRIKVLKHSHKSNENPVNCEDLTKRFSLIRFFAEVFKAPTDSRVKLFPNILLLLYHCLFWNMQLT